MTGDGIPEFAIVGHPNEGKSAVVSTLAEDDTVRVTPYPGETVVCQTFPVVIDGKEIIRFIDTPGFQNPRKTLKWIKDYRGDPAHMLSTYLKTHAEVPEFRDDCRLIEPIAGGAGVIYVVDGSRPVRNVDLTEMEVLRLTGRPRMAVINCKEDETAYIETWKGEFRKHFNAIRVFNANKATYAERIDLLENLKGIDQDWGPALERVISAFKEDWRQRNAQTALIICELLETCLGYSITRSFRETTTEKPLKERLQKEYAVSIEKIEEKAHRKIRTLYKHNIFNYSLPAHSILNENLFSRKTPETTDCRGRNGRGRPGRCPGPCRGRDDLWHLYDRSGSLGGRVGGPGRREATGQVEGSGPQLRRRTDSDRPDRDHPVRLCAPGPRPDLLFPYHQLGPWPPRLSHRGTWV